MSFPLNVYILAFLSACGTALVTLPLWRKWCMWTGLVDDPGHRKIHDTPIPLAGGLAIMTALLAPLLLGWLVLGSHSSLGGLLAASVPLTPSDSGASGTTATAAFLLKYGFGHRAIQLLGISFGAIGMLLVGYLDDKYELRPSLKFAGQFLIALAVAAAGVRITLFVPSLAFSYAVTVLWILTVINAFNFMDNMNGLCAGLGAIGAWFFACVAASQGQYLVALVAFLTCGALLGFLPYNFPSARVFLGDAGSHLIGYLLAVLAILPHFHTPRHPRPWAVGIPLFVLAVPLLDMVWVVLLRWRMGKPFYVGDTNHLSHRLVRLGWSRTRAVLLIWLAAAIIGGLVCLL